MLECLIFCMHSPGYIRGLWERATTAGTLSYGPMRIDTARHQALLYLLFKSASALSGSGDMALSYLSSRDVEISLLQVSKQLAPERVRPRRVSSFSSIIRDIPDLSD